MAADPKQTNTAVDAKPSVKSHPNDSEPQLKKSMEGLQPNTAKPAKAPHYTVNNGKVVNELDNSVVAEGGDDKVLQETADKMNEEVKKAQEQAQQGQQPA